MRVTRVEELDKSRNRIYLDGEFAFVLYKGELRLYHIKEGEQLAAEDYRVIMEEVLPKRAKLRAMNLLLHRQYTTAQLCAKLRAGQYPEVVIDAALEYVASFHYTDDLRYAVDYIMGQAGVRSRRRIEQDLLHKGIAKETLESAWQKWEEEGGAQDEEQMIRQILQKRHYDFLTADYRDRQKQAAFLMRKGFGRDSIRRVLGGSGEDNLYDTNTFA